MILIETIWCIPRTICRVHTTDRQQVHLVLEVHHPTTKADTIKVYTTVKTELQNTKKTNQWALKQEKSN